MGLGDVYKRQVYPQSDRTRRLQKMFRALLRAAVARGATVLTDPNRRGAAIWQPSHDRSFGVGGSLRTGWSMVSGGARMRRGIALMRITEARHPKEPHWYLAVLGTDPAHQGHGVGSALVRHVVEATANTETPAYLETETEANVAYYDRLGFRVIDEVDVGRDGPHLWLMWRDAPLGG